MQVHDLVLIVAGASSARVFQSTAASQNDEWLSLSTGYVMAVFDCIRALKAWPPFLRPFAFRFLRERAAIRDQWTRARPVVAASLQARAALGGGNLESPPSCLDFLCSNKNAHMASDVDKQLAYQMTLVAVGTVTTHATIVQALYDLALYPEYIPILREELAAAEVDAAGMLTKAGVMSLMKMDSFVKESQRLSHPDLTTFQRAATADMQLPDGTHVPRGTKLEIATAAIYADERIYLDPQTFDGLRYYRMRQVPGEESRHQFVSVSNEDLSFGFGTHACPGRFLGIYNTKIILAEIIRHYDLKLPDGAGRPVNTEVEVIVSPDPEAKILMRSRVP